MSYSVHLHDFQAFSCTSCGRCCRPWEVALEGTQRRAIEASQAYQARLKPNYVPLKVETPGIGQLQDRGDGHCTFLDADNLCELHAELGGRSKPLGCQLFPYQTVRTPGGMFVYLSFGCPPVVAGLDRDLATNQRELDEALGDYAAPLLVTPEAPYLVDLTESTAIPWEAYRRLESDLLTAFVPAQPIRSCLVLAMAVLLADHSNHLELTRTFNTEDTDFALEILRKFASSMVSVVENIDENSDRQALAAAVEAGEITFSSRFELTMPPLSLDEPNQDWILEIYHRYFQNAILGKALLRSTVVGKLLVMASGFALTNFYAEAYRRTRELETLDLQCVIDAFAITEFHHGAHSPAMAGYSQAMEETYSYIVGGLTNVAPSPSREEATSLDADTSP